MLTQQLVSLFNEVHANDDCQLVFTTHENDIMSYDYFRRDEIWFVERGEDGASRLYPLDDFAAGDARSDARLIKRVPGGQVRRSARHQHVQRPRRARPGG